MSGNAVRPARAWWRRRLVWGAFVAVALGIVSVVFDQGGPGLRFGVLITLAGATAALASDLLFRLEEVASEQEARESKIALELSGPLSEFPAFTNATPSCRAFFSSFVSEWSEIEKRGSQFQALVLEDAQLAFRQLLRELSIGTATVDKGRLNFRLMPLQAFAEIRSLSATNPAFWDGQLGAEFLKNQREAIRAGTLTVERILMLDAEEAAVSKEIVARQVQAGIAITIVLREDVPAMVLSEVKDQSLVTDRGGVVGVLRPVPGGEAETFATDEKNVGDARRIFNSLRPYVRAASSVYPDLQESRRLPPHQPITR